MKMRAPVTAILSLLLLCAPIAYAANADLGSAAKTGAAELESAGPLAFGPDGILFVGDTKAAAIYAIDTGDRKEATKAGALNLEGVTAKIAALAGTTEDGIRINDLAVNHFRRRPTSRPRGGRVTTRAPPSSLSAPTVTSTSSHSRRCATPGPRSRTSQITVQKTGAIAVCA